MLCTLQGYSTASNDERASSASENIRGARLKLSRLILATVAITIVLSSFLAAAYTFHFFGLGLTNCSTRPVSQPNMAIFTVVMANEGLNVGFNGSRYNGTPWPVVNVTLGQSVIIHVVNNDTTQSHGFAITHYFDSGVTLRPGECYDVKFTANQAGSFNVFCNIFCTIHVYMQNGRLNVNP